MVEVSLVSNWYFWVRGHPYKTSVRFSNFWPLLPPYPQVSALSLPSLLSQTFGVHFHKAKYILRRKYFAGLWTFNFHFFDEWEICEVKNYQLYTVYIYTFWSYDPHRDRAIRYLYFETNVNVHSCLTPVLPPSCQHVSASSWTPPPNLADIFMDDP